MVSAEPKPSYEELEAKVAALGGLNERLLVMVELLQAQVEELKAQIGKNSSNSSKPPSSDGLAKPAPTSLRGRSGRKPGGQKGHPGSALMRVDDPKKTERHEPVCCRGCRASLDSARQVGAERRQVFDLPEIVPEVTEHLLVKRRCGCGMVTTAAAPFGVDAPVQYGPNIAAVAMYLYAGQFLSKDRTATALAELFGTPMSAGTVATMATRAAATLGTSGFLTQVKDQIADAEVAHFDETGLRVQGRLRWVHSASTGTYVLLTVHDKRGVEAMNAAGVLPGFSGIAMHDGWGPYDTYTAATHARCNAHLLRELRAVTDHHTRTRPEDPWCWADQAAGALLDMKTLVEQTLELDGTLNSLDHDKLDDLVHLWRSAARLGAEATKTRASALEKDHNALARRLIDRQDDHLRFTTDPRIPWDNNAAERTIRMVKIRQKVSGCLRTLAGAAQFCATRSYLATTARNGLTMIEALTRLTHGRPWLPTAAT